MMEGVSAEVERLERQAPSSGEPEAPAPRAAGCCRSYPGMSAPARGGVGGPAAT